MQVTWFPVAGSQTRAVPSSLPDNTYLPSGLNATSFQAQLNVHTREAAAAPAGQNPTSIKDRESQDQSRARHLLLLNQIFCILIITYRRSLPFRCLFWEVKNGKVMRFPLRKILRYL